MLARGCGARPLARCLRRPLHRSYSSKGPVAYPGAPGAFSEQALLDFYSSSPSPVEAVGVAGYDAIFSGVADGTFSAGVVPIEDSISGTFHSVYDQLISHKELHVIGEQASVTDCCLCVVPGVERSQISKIKSNPEILKQCSGYLEHMRQRRPEGGELAWLPALNTAECALSLQTSGATDTAVICSARAAQLYELEAIDHSISDCNVSTRYLVVSKDRASLGVGERLKSSIVFALPNEPLAIFKAISAFALRGVNISKIESRPAAAIGDVFTAAYHWEYVFYMDLEVSSRHGGVAIETTLDAALQNLAEFAISVRELGRYAQNLGQEDRVFRMKPEDLAR